MLARQEVINALRAMPDTISFTEIKDTIEIIESNCKAVEDIKTGRVYTTSEAKKRIREMAEAR